MKEKKQKVFIVLTHTRTMNKHPRASSEDSGPPRPRMEIQERCEFVNEVKKRHIAEATLIIDYINQKIIKDRSNSGRYEEFDAYLRERHPDQMKELDAEYRPVLVPADDAQKIIQKIAEEEALSPVILDADSIERN